MTHLRVLIGDDSHMVGKSLVSELGRLGHSSDYLLVQTPQAILEALARENWDMIIVNSHLSGFDRVEPQELARRCGSKSPIIIVVDGANKEIGPTIELENGYWVYRGDSGQLWPVARQGLAGSLRGTVEGSFLEPVQGLRSADQEVVCIAKMEPQIESAVTNIVHPEPIQEYPSEAMKLVIRKLLAASEREITVLLLGESGSGKDYVARYIHDHSRRKNGPYFAINCAAVAPELAESELFGHEKGAFTGAHTRKKGLLELAERGTLLLNEIGELSLPLQAKLLTFFDTRHITRVGGEKCIPVNTRIIAATNRDLEAEVAAGRFRRDLFYRLNVVSVVIPPLRQRREDIPIISKQILSKLYVHMELPRMPVIRGEAMSALLNYSWPGNIRELRNALERALILDSYEITTAALALTQDPEEWSIRVTFPLGKTLCDVTKEVRKSLIQEALRRSGGKQSKAAELLGISRHALKCGSEMLGLGEDEKSSESSSHPQ